MDPDRSPSGAAEERFLALLGLLLLLLRLLLLLLLFFFLSLLGSFLDDDDEEDLVLLLLLAFFLSFVGISVILLSTGLSQRSAPPAPLQLAADLGRLGRKDFTHLQLGD